MNTVAMDSTKDMNALVGGYLRDMAYVETAIAHARLAGISPDRIVNCWPLDRLLAWIAGPTREAADADLHASASFHRR